MSQVIAGIYELHKQIGSGGGGIVYLGRHLRLEKEVVLKADKRRLSTRPEMLRREVDMLKGLSHMYIPQVYDFVQENGVVYTVMDFIGGESLDKMLERGEIPSQPQVIRWACQLLEALSYLHSRPPYGILHGDIKPANIMLRPSGDICLIDYNIALALGEDGAVKVGYSLGYASPEHYGIEYKSGRERGKTRSGSIFPSGRRESTVKGTKARKTVLVGESEDSYEQSSGNSISGKHPITLDARSDIYSLGATLYHLISGHHPAEDAQKVKPLGPAVCSPQISEIIQKAMSPDAEMRYQTADEMLTAFRQLHKRDKRVVRHKRHIAMWASLVSGMFLAGGACSFVGLKQMEQIQEALALAEYSSNSLAEGNVSEAVRLALQAIPEEKGILEAPVTAQAQKALTDALAVYDLSEGYKSLDAVEFPSAPFGITVSPEGTYFAVIYPYEAAVFKMEDRQKIISLAIENSALSDVIFVDETHIIYAGDQGITAYDLNAQKVLWTGETATTLAVSADGTVAAAVNRDEDHGCVYRISDGKKIAECSFGGRHMQVAANDTFANPKDAVFTLNKDGSMLAVSFKGGGLQIFDLEQPDDDLILFEESEYGHFEGGFCGSYFAFAADGNAKSIFGLIDTKEAVYLGEYESPDNILLKTDESGIYMANGNLLVSFDLETFEETELAYTDDKKITGFSIGNPHILVATDTPGFSFYDGGANRMSSESSKENCDFTVLSGDYAILGNRNEPSLRFMKLESHRDKLLLSYDARYAHDEARISHDKKTAMLFNNERFRLYDMEGNIISEVELPDPEQVYDQQFRKSDGNSWLEVIWYDGTVRCYSGADGSVISEEKKDAPSKDLNEEFYTDKYRIVSSLHDAPVVYSLDNNREVAKLEKDAYLTYVTQMGEYIITEYVSTSGERYGLLLDDRLQTLARLPGLCDIADGMLVFDYESGNLRQCPLYSLEELITLGKAYEDTLDSK